MSPFYHSLNLKQKNIQQKSKKRNVMFGFTEKNIVADSLRDSIFIQIRD